jgi:hypothetical protein
VTAINTHGEIEVLEPLRFTSPVGDTSDGLADAFVTFLVKMLIVGRYTL